MDTTTLTRVETRCASALTKYEARIEVLGVTVDPFFAAEGKLLVEIDYRDPPHQSDRQLRLPVLLP